MKKLTALFLSLSLLVCSFLFASAAESSNEGANVTEHASEVFIDNSYESLELGSSVDSSAEEEIREAIETFSETDDIKTEITTVGVTTEARETAEIQEVTTTRETAESASDLESVSAQEITETQEADANQEATATQEITEIQEAINSQETTEAAEPQSENEDLPIPPSSPLSDEEEIMPIATYDTVISWTGMIFTYHEANKGEWNPDIGNYKEGTEKEAYWGCGDNQKYGTFTVKNNGSTVLDFTFSFAKSEKLNGTLVMRHSTDNSGDTSTWDYDYDADTKLTVEGSKTGYFYVVPGNGSSFDFSQLTGEQSVLLGEITIKIESEKIHDPPAETPGPNSINPAEQPVFE